MKFSILAILIASSLSSAALAETVTIYRGATLIDGTGGPARRDASITVRDDKIVAVGRSRDPAPEGAMIVDATGLYVLPGLIDSHVHIATPPHRKRAEAQMRRWLYGGVTAVRGMADDTRSVAELGRAARMAEIPGPDIRYAALMAGPTFFDDPRTRAAAQDGTPGQVPWMQAIDTATNLALAVAKARGTGASAIKIYANLPGEQVKAITAEAHRQGMAVWAHGMVFPASPVEVIGAGADVISHTCYLAYQFNVVKPGSYQEQRPVELDSFMKGGDHPGMAGLFAEMKAKGILLDPTLRVFAEEAKRIAAGKGSVRRCPLDLATRLTGQAWRAGVQISAGTDGFTADADEYPSLHEELELLVKAGIPPAQVIRSATLVGAQTLGEEAAMGTIAPGKLANLVFVRKDPLSDIGNLRSVAWVVKRGRRYDRADYAPISAEEAEKPAD